jgi:glycosyltransferase involved in cell wall biosynthesis
MTLSVVIPTRNRRELVVAKARWCLEHEEVTEVVVVADGCTDGTDQALLGLDDARLRVLVNEASVGPAPARRQGAEAAGGEWLLMLDDDDDCGPCFVSTLLSEALQAGSDVVSAPWLPPAPRPIAERVHAARLRPRTPRLDRYDRFPPEPVRTPWLTGNYLVRRQALLQTSYGVTDHYRFNHFREETDLFLSMWAAGCTMTLTPGTYSHLPVQVEGGVDKRARLRYEYWVLRNHWTFLRRHRTTLQQLGSAGRWLAMAWLGYAVERAALLGRLWLTARLRRLRRP